MIIEAPQTEQCFREHGWLYQESLKGRYPFPADQVRKPTVCRQVSNITR
ncbi:uncharacterized protein PgNI_10035, partial [Pyricularia grisea]|uniref:Uncharacterized protein n=1 Tax=Pyricularia grisea TaxID=148305 RepID=A0A6P8ATP3_PYRGI